MPGLFGRLNLNDTHLPQFLCCTTQNSLSWDTDSQGCLLCEREDTQECADRWLSLALHYWVINGQVWQRCGPTVDKDATGMQQTCHWRSVSVHGAESAKGVVWVVCYNDVWESNLMGLLCAKVHNLAPWSHNMVATCQKLWWSLPNLWRWTCFRKQCKGTPILEPLWHRC